jgi:hypothetical protein
LAQPVSSRRGEKERKHVEEWQEEGNKNLILPARLRDFNGFRRQAHKISPYTITISTTNFKFSDTYGGPYTSVA